MRMFLKKFQESLLLCNSVQSKIVKKHTFTRVQYMVAWSIFFALVAEAS